MAGELSPESRTLVRSRIPGYEDLSQEEGAARAIKIIAADFYLYCERNLMIKDKRGKLVTLVPNWAQQKVVELVLDDLRHDRPVRYIVLKARQMGLSTIIEALGFWWTITHKNQNAVIIAHKKKAAKNLYKMFKRFYVNVHPSFMQEVKYNTVDALTFDISDAAKEAWMAQPHKPGEVMPGLQSEIQTMVASEGEGRSDTILFFHGSEVAFWDKGADVLSSALQALPLGPRTFAFLESTANGVGGYFYDEWQFAKKGESTFKPLFFAWHEHPEYELDCEVPITTYDDEETELLTIFKEKKYPPFCWDKKITWRREKKKEFRAEPDKFYQEYPKDDLEAFLASGRPAFDIRSLIKMEEIARRDENKPIYGTLVKEKNELNKTVLVCQFTPMTMDGHDPTPLKIWELPKKEERYTIAIDVAEGQARGHEGQQSGDYSVIDVMAVSTLKTVARWRGHIDPDLLGDVAVDIGTYYNYALIGPETNNHGLTTTQRIRDLMYRNLYQRETSEDEQFQERTSKMGWQTNRKTKPIMINELRRALREGDIIDYDIIFIRECMTYVIDDNGYFGAQENMFDDCVMAKAINLQMCNWSSYDLSEVNIYKPTIRQGNNATSKTNNRQLFSKRKALLRQHRREHTQR